MNVDRSATGTTSLPLHLARLAAAVILYATSSISIAVARDPQDVVSLIQIAKVAGYTYNYVGSDDAVVLSKGRLTIYIRPGYPLYDVNDHTVSIAGAIPEARSGDVLVSNAFTAKLKWYARQPAALAGYIPPKAKVTHVGMPGQNDALATPSPAPTGPSPITDLTVAQHHGSYAIDVHGHAAPNTTVYIQITGVLADTIPRVTLSRKDLQTNADGVFDGTLSVANLYFLEPLIQISASTDPKLADLVAHTSLNMKENLNTERVPADTFKP